MGLRTLERVLDGMYAAACKEDVNQVRRINFLFSTMYGNLFPNWANPIGIESLPTAYDGARNACVNLVQEGLEGDRPQIKRDYDLFKYEIAHEQRAAQASTAKASQRPFALSLSL